MAIPAKLRGWKWSFKDASNPTLVAVLDNTSKALHIATAQDSDTDWAVAALTHPGLYIHSETTPATDYLLIGKHDGTTAYIDVVGGTTLQLAIAGTNEVNLTASALSPSTSDGNALGTTALMWADLFLASAAVINFNNGNVTITHSAANLAIAGGDVTIASATGLNVGSTTQLTVSDGDGATNLIPEVQALGVGTAFAGGALAIGTFNTTNDRTVSPKLILVKGAAATQVATTAVADNEVVGSIIAYASDSADFETAVGAIEFVVDDVGAPGAGAIGGSLEFYTTADGGETLTLAFTVGSNQNIYVANNNGVVIGHTAQIAAGAVTSEFQMHGTAPADSSALLGAWSADAVPPRLYFAKSRSATIGTFSIITTGDNLGEILAFGDDGVDFNSNGNAACAIIFDSAGTIAADRVPGQILIQTATDAAPSVLTTAITITPAQVVEVTQGTLALGVAGTKLGALEIDGNTSGTVTVSVAAAAGTYTLTLPPGANTNAGYQLTCAGADTITTWGAAASLRELKDIHGPADPQDALDAILGTSVYRFHYKPGKGTQDMATEYVGVMADEAPWAMHYEGGVVNPVNTLGYTVLAIKALQAEIVSLRGQMATR